MSKLLLYADPHFCSYSSVVRMRGEKYSKRLETLIQSMNWINQIAEEEKVDKIICLGDMLDRSDMTAEEISALSEIDISNHYFLLGNHEMYSKEFASNKVFVNAINEPTYWDLNNNSILFLPYQKEEYKESIKDIKRKLNITTNDLIILSHNDIKGLQYASYCSKDGYSIDEIKEDCSCFINGHLHNGSLIHKDEDCKILNLGSLTGQNFSNDAMRYSHCIAILDTDTLNIDLINNPYALLFFKQEIRSVEHLQTFLNIVDKHTETSIVSIKIREDLIEQASEVLNKCLFKRIQVEQIINTSDYKDLHKKDKEDIDHMAKFKTFIREKYNGEVNMLILEEELSKI